MKQKPINDRVRGLMNCSPIATQLPAAAEGMTPVETFTGCCARCGNPAEPPNLRGRVAVFANVVSIEAAAMCHACRLVTPYHVRFYRDGRTVTKRADRWIDTSAKRGTFFDRIKAALRLT